MKKSVILLASASMVLAGASIIGLNRLNGASSPDPVKADGSISNWSDLKNAVKNAVDNATIVLGADVTSGGGADDRIQIDRKNITIDLNGYDVNRNRTSGSSNGHAFEIQGNSTVTFINSRNGSEKSIITGGYAKNGGAINIHEGSTATFNNITFKNNYASVDGGAIFNRGHLVLNNCKIDECEAQETGGAIYNSEEGYFELTSVDVSKCDAKDDGGAINIHLHTGNQCTISDSSFASNYSSTEDGGAISLAAEDGGVLNIDNTTFSDNQVKSNKHNGGAIEVENGTLKLNGVTFKRNFAANGGAIYFAGGNNDEFLISDGAKASQFDGNVASDYGGAIFSNSSTLNFTNATFLRNQATNNGGAILLHGGTATFNNGSYSANESLNQSGGAIYLESKATLNLNGGNFSDNSALGNGGAFTLNSSSETINVKGAIKTENDFAPVGPSVYLPNGSVLNVTGSLEGSSIIVSRYDRLGNIAANYGAHNSLVDPSSIFIAADTSLSASLDGQNVALVEASPEAADPKLLAPFVPTSQVVNHGQRVISGNNWMSGISGERYLNEFNIPGTHDTSMRSIGISAGAGSAFGSGDDYAITQKRYIPEQFEEGVRIVDIRLNNRYPTENWPKNKMHDDGENLWMCHGKTGGGTYYAEDEEGNLINLYMVLDYARDFLTRHPTETLIMGFTDESYYKEYFPAINERLHDILAKYTAQYPINPSTGESLWYFQGGDLMKEFTRFPQLKEVRGKIMFEPGGIKTIGGFRSVEIDGVKKYSQSTSYKVWWDKKYDDIKKFFDANENKHELHVDGDSWYNDGKHFEKLFRIGLNCAPQKSWWPYLPDKTPIYHSDRLLQKLFFDDDAYWKDIKGKYLGWVNTDGATSREWGKIFRSNFIQEAEDYCTVTVDPNLDGGTNYKKKTYTVLKNTEITIPNFNYDYDQWDETPNYFQGWSAGGKTYFVGSTFTVTENVTFQAMWASTENGENDISVDVEFKDCDNVDELRPTSINFTINDAPKPTLTLSEEDGWHASYTGAITNIVPSTWEGNAKLQGFDADSTNKYCYTVKGNPAVGYTFTFIHTNTATLANISGSIAWSDENDYDKYRPDTVDLTVALKDGETQIATQTFDGDRDVKNWNYTLGTDLPKYRDGELIDYNIVVINDKKWAYIAEYDFIQNGHNLTAVHSPDKSYVSVTIRWADNNNSSKVRPTSLHVHIKVDGVDILNQPVSISKPDDVSELTWNSDYLVNRYEERANYTDSNSRTSIAYSIEITDTEDNQLEGYTPIIREVGTNTNCFEVIMALDGYDLDDVTAVETKIDALGEEALDYNTNFINKLTEASSAYSDLSDEEKTLVRNYDTLVEKEYRFNETYGYLYEIDKEIAKVVPTLYELDYNDWVKALNDLGQKVLDLSKEDRDKLIHGDGYNTALTSFANIQSVINKISDIDEIELTEACKNSIIAARTAYNALNNAADRNKVDNYSDLVEAEAQYFALDFLSKTGEVCSTPGDNGNHLSGLSKIWTSLGESWGALSNEAKALLKAGKGTYADFLARYTHIATRYGLVFSEGPVVSPSNLSESALIQNRSLDVVAISLIAISSTALVGALLVALHKRKDDRAQ